MTANGHKVEEKAAGREIRLMVVHPGPVPACIVTGAITCRGCPGWNTMLQALKDPETGWTAYPIHCPASGLTRLLQLSKKNSSLSIV